MKVFKIKTGNPETYKNFNDLSNSKIIVEHLIQYENEIEIGAPVFFYVWRRFYSLGEWIGWNM
jgi:hypothetical protein